MDIAAFLTKVLPSQGLYCIAVAKKKYLDQFFVDTIDKAVSLVREWDTNGYTVYFATASFITDVSRRADNAMFLRTLRLDIDCGEGKSFPTKQAAAEAFVAFALATGMPAPMIVDSGNGLHIYWVLTRDLTPAQWVDLAAMLKQTCLLYSFDADPSVTSDVARILRPVGSHNRKHGSKPVSLLRDAPEYPPEQIDAALRSAINAKGMQPLKGFLPSIMRGVPGNDDLSGGIEYPESDPERIAERCAIVRQMRDSQGDVNYEQWRGIIGLLKFCENGEAKAYEWSAQRAATGHSQTDVEQKWSTWSAGPATCDFFRRHNSETCAACKHTVTSPIQLGRPDPEPVSETTPTQQTPELDVVRDFVPKGYMRATDGKLYVKEDDAWREFSKYDVVPIVMERDENGDIVIRVHVSFPSEGRKELVVPMVKLAEIKELKKLMYSKGLCLRSEEDMKTMSGYLIRYIDELQNAHAPVQLYQQMGWTATNDFVCGENVYTKAGAKKASLSATIPDSIREGFRQAGSLDEWRQAIGAYSREGMEGYAFGFLSAPGAVLLKFTQYRGMVLSLVSPQPGEGKSTVQKAINSFFGDPSQVALQAKDTVLAQYNRLSIYQNMAATVDEVTVMQPEQLSEFVYQVPQGRQRLRLTRDATERQSALEWATIVVTSSNQSLVAKLATLKHSADAEAVRIFEYYIRHPRSLKKHEADKLFGKLDSNYGVAGPVFVDYVVNNLPSVMAMVQKLQEKIDIEASIQSKERFWSALMAVNIAGGMICKQLGLVDFDMKAIYNWSLRQLDHMRGTLTSEVTDAKSLLGQYFSEHQNSILVLDKAGDARRGVAPVIKLSPNNSLHVRVEQDTRRVWVNRDHIRKWLINRMADYNEVVHELAEQRILLNSSMKKSLGQGTYYTSTPVMCWELDIDPPAVVAVPSTDTLDNKLEAV